MDEDLDLLDADPLVSPWGESPRIVLGSKYYKKAVAGDGTEIRAGSRVVFKKGRRSLFSYGSPDPPEGAVGRVKDNIHQFRGEIWAQVEFPEGIYDVRVKELRSADAPPKAAPVPSATPGSSQSTSLSSAPSIRSLPSGPQASAQRPASSSFSAWAGGVFAALTLLALARALEWV